MTPIRRNWVFSFLWVNAAVGLMMLVLLSSHRLANGREALQVVAFALIYANLTGLLGLLLLGAVMGKKPRALHMPLVIAGIMLVAVPLGSLLAQTLLQWTGLLVPPRFWPQYFQTLRSAMPLALVFGLGAVVHGSLRSRVQTMEQRLHEKEVSEERAQKLAAEARLRSLEAQIHPHFLFNTLNSISSLITVDPAQAERMVGKLATLLRASLDNRGQSLIPLEQELAMVESYLEIERARFGASLRSSIEIPADLENASVPPMSVQSLVENAVKHGIVPQSGGEVAVKAVADNANVRIEVHDSGPGFDLSLVPAGHGLDNLVSRLHALFGPTAGLDVHSEHGRSVVAIVLPRV